MKITCQSCGAKYAIADEKVRGRRVKVRCKGCNEPIIVDGYAEREAAAANAPADTWSVNLSDTDQRSMTTDEIVSAWNAGQMPPDAFVWKEGMGDWIPLASSPELAPYLSAPQHSAPVQPEPEPAPAFGFASGGVAARVETSRGAADIFGGQATAGSEDDVVSSASAPGATAYDDQKPTGARNENSVLFSLDALKAGVGPAKPGPAAPVKRGTVPPPKEEKADLDDIMNIGGGGMGGPLFGMNANQALLAAPPPPPDPPPRPSIPSEMPAAFGSMPPPNYAQPKKSNTVVFAVGGGVALLAVIAIVIGIFALRSGKTEEAKAETGSKSAEKSGKSGSATEEKKEETRVKDDKKAEETKPADPAVAASGAPGEKKEVSEEDKKRFAEAMKKKEEEEKNKKPEEKKEEVAKKEEPSSGVASFNKGAAIAALGGAAAQASGCKRPGGPTGSGKAVVTFAPSGRVTSANITGGEFPGTPVGSCIAGVFRRAQVPAFSGDPVTVSKAFSISP